MGIHSRDYIRESDGPSSFSAPGGRAVWKSLIITTGAVFLLQMLTNETQLVVSWLSLDPPSLQSGQVWRLLTYAFCHDVDNLFHILFNMAFLWWFGKTLESMYGSREFLLFYLTAAVVAGLAFIGLGLVMGSLNPAIGASGSIMAVTMVYAMHFPRHRIYIWGIIPLEIRWLVVMYVVFDLLPVLSGLSGGPGAGDNIAHSAHLGGLAFGFLYCKYNIRLERLLGRFRRPRFGRIVGPRRKFKIYEPTREGPRENLDQQVDAILDKINQQGEESLTKREREILKAASQRYKNR
jgi:membrane associated rhomboid family serine protease